MINLALRRNDGEVIPLKPEILLPLEETVEYEIISEGNPFFECFFDGIQLKPNAQGTLTIRPGNWVADTELRFQWEDGFASIPVRVQPRQQKLSDALWIAMLSDLENWLPGVSAGVEGGQSGSIGKEGVPLPFIAEALIPLLPSFERCLLALLDQPRQRDISVQEDVPLRMVRRVDRETLRWVTRHPHIQEQLDPWKSLGLGGKPPLISQRLTIETNDHPANRYISWLVRRVESCLRSTEERLEKAAKTNISDDSLVWCRTRAKKLRDGADRLQRLWRGSFLSEVQREPLSDTGLQVVLDDPTYLRVHQIGRLFLNPLFRFDPAGGEYQTAVRPSYSVYELWAFLAVCQQMEKSLPGWSWTTCKLGNLDPCASGEGAVYRAKSTSGAIVEIRFNATFSSYFNRANRSRWSISGERRPDIIVNHKPKNDEGRWLALDAKYRVGRSNLADAFSSVHIYRDALRFEGFGEKCQAVLLLSPSHSVDTTEWFSKEYIQLFGAGVWELKPGVSSQLLSGWINQVLGIGDGQVSLPNRTSGNVDKSI